MFEALERFLTETLPSPITRIIFAVLAIAVGLWLAKWLSNTVSKAMNRGNADAGLVSFLKSSTRISLQVMTFVVALSILGVPTGEMVTIISAAAVAVGIALRDSMANVASGIIILFTKPFGMGDFIEIEQYSGTVTSIAIMSTRLLTVDNRRVIVPNSLLTTNMLVNYSQEPTRRIDMLFTIAYEADIEQASALVLQCAEQTGTVLPDPAPRCVVKEQGQHGVVLGTIMWCERTDYLDTTYAMNKLVKDAFDEAGIGIPVFEVHVADTGFAKP